MSKLGARVTPGGSGPIIYGLSANGLCPKRQRPNGSIVNAHLRGQKRENKPMTRRGNERRDHKKARWRRERNVINHLLVKHHQFHPNIIFINYVMECKDRLQ